MTATSLASKPASEGAGPVVLAADRIFSLMGAGGLDHDTVAHTASIGVDTVRAAYPSVIDLVIGVLQHRHQQWVNGLATASAAATEPRDQILSLFSYLESCFMDDTWRGCAFINGYGELGRAHPVVAELADTHLASIEQHLHRLCTAAELPPFIADGLSLLVQGAKVEAAIHRTTRPARSARMTAAMLMSVYEPDRVDHFI